MRNRFHAICPYFAMFPESFAERWIGRISDEGDVVLDPFCGRGTAPFQALLMGRRAVACDVNPVACCVTRAKTNAPDAGVVKRRISLFERGFSPEQWDAERRGLPEFFRYAYSPSTLRQILYLRTRLNWRKSNVDAMIGALTLGALHGETQKSGSYLSNQMPRTISTKPDYSVRFWKKHGYKAPRRDLFDLLRDRLEFRYEGERPAERAVVYQMDMRDLARKPAGLPEEVRCVITSPPYLNVTSFEEDQWLRLWFLGGAPRPTYKRVSRDDRHESAGAYWDFIADMWRMLGIVLAPGAKIVVRLGARKLSPEQLASGLLGTSRFSRRRVDAVGDPEVSAIKGRQTNSFRPGSKGCVVEVDCLFRMR